MIPDEATIPCPICQTPLAPTWRACPGCGTALTWREGQPVPRLTATPVAAPANQPPQPPPQVVYVQAPPRAGISPQTLGLVGALLLAVGTFLPVLSIPLGGTITYFNNGQGDGVFALVLAVVAGLLAFRAVRWLWIPGGLALLLLAYSFVNVQSKIADIQASSTGLGSVLANGVSLQWGWVILALGAGLIFGASRLARSATT